MERTVRTWDDVVPFLRPEVQEKCTPEIIASMNEQLLNPKRQLGIADCSFTLGDLTSPNTACHAALRVAMSKMPYLFNGVIKSKQNKPELKKACNIFMDWMVSENNPAWAGTIRHALIFRNKDNEVTGVIWPDTSIIPMVQTAHFCIMTREVGEHIQGLARFCEFYDDPETGNGDVCLSWLLSRNYNDKINGYVYLGYHGAFQPYQNRVPIPFIKGPAAQTLTICNETWGLSCNASYMVWDDLKRTNRRTIEEFVTAYHKIKETK